MSKVLLYQVTVRDTDLSNGVVIRNTSATSMDISNLEPCSTYTVGVSSVNVFLVPGEASNVSHTTSSEYFSKIMNLSDEMHSYFKAQFSIVMAHTDHHCSMCENNKHKSKMN